MNKPLSFLSIFMVIFLLAAGCGLIKKEDEEGGEAGGGGTAASKALSNKWYVLNEAWSYNLQGIPTNDTPTAAQIVFADLSVCNCLISLNGTNDAGGYKIASCLTSPPSGSAMAPSTGCVSAFETNNGTYLRNGTSLCLKKSGGGPCLELH